MLFNAIDFCGEVKQPFWLNMKTILLNSFESQPKNGLQKNNLINLLLLLLLNLS